MSILREKQGGAIFPQNRQNVDFAGILWYNGEPKGDPNESQIYWKAKRN